VTGELGGSSAGLRLLRLGTVPSEEQRALIRRHLRPVARVGEGALLARHGATAMMDISDGFALDLSRLARASGVGARVELDRVPVAHLADMGDALGGGEDYELLACMPDDAAVESATAALKEAFGVPLTQVGVVFEGEGLRAVDEDGLDRPLEPAGWDHFR